MIDLDPWYVAREHMREALTEDLLGGPQDTEIDEAPLDRFILGILHPRSAVPTAENGEDSASTKLEAGGLEEAADEPEVATGASDSDFDPAVALTRMRYPSSMGLTFAVASSETTSVTVDVSAARYSEAEAAGEIQEQGDRIRHRGRGGSEVWIRTQKDQSGLHIDVSRPGSYRHELGEGLELRTVVRAPRGEIVSVTLVLLNTLVHVDGRKDALCWFQPEMIVTCAAGFHDRPQARSAGVDDEDLDSYDLMYRDLRNLAVGHGCAVDWRDAECVSELRTTFVPSYELPLSEARGAAGLGMEALGQDGGVPVLRELVEDYREWISRRRTELDGLTPRLRTIAERHLREATRASDRMGAGIELLEREPDAMRAFRMMNLAMNEQRLRQEKARGGVTQTQSWRPFQIAFVLINLPGIAEPNSHEREIADLLWFPTGGGKTEAYLGLIGFTILLRRLRDGSAGGVSVIMRYTLRLLTLQQFERAAGLVCALESARRRELAGTPAISIGLWVGQGGAPNSVKDARSALKKLAQGQDVESGNPRQLLRCPWCGSQLGDRSYRIDQRATQMTVHCAEPACEFADGLPVHLVDEDVYRERPSLVIATVDKFALMAWKADVATLFSTDDKHPRPDLIVQDELHLISGPLGTMVGLYETAVDAACTKDARPKVVASTATIRRAKSQVRAVFNREASQFPPPGLDSKDSYFALEAAREDKGTRQYVGLLAPGVSQATLLVRAYAALLQAAHSLQSDDSVKDAYWTLLGYFNSLRVLGSAFMQVIDDVPDRLKVIADRNEHEKRSIAEPRELTSRKKSSEIPLELDLLGRSLPSGESPDVVLATNMISVGVDVDRLGLMVVMGQPQTTAEYIQATSRVGRRHPGLVVMLYNGARSRDLSHFESFSSYHRGLYRQVEATGATPFAARARDRGVHGVLVSLARMLVAQGRPEAAAGSVRSWRRELEAAADLLVARATDVMQSEASHLRDQVDELIDTWLDASGDLDKYAGWRDRHGALIVPAGGVGPEDDQTAFPVDQVPWPTLTSLRDVDAESGIYLVPSRRA